MDFLDGLVSLIVLVMYFLVIVAFWILVVLTSLWICWFLCKHRAEPLKWWKAYLEWTLTEPEETTP
jgi:hypothetical protein